MKRERKKKIKRRGKKKMKRATKRKYEKGEEKEKEKKKEREWKGRGWKRMQGKKGRDNALERLELSTWRDTPTKDACALLVLETGMAAKKHCAPLGLQTYLPCKRCPYTARACALARLGKLLLLNLCWRTRAQALKV